MVILVDQKLMDIEVEKGDFKGWLPILIWTEDHDKTGSRNQDNSKQRKNID